MSSFFRRAGRWAVALPVAALVAACQDSITVGRPAPSSPSAAQVAEAGATHVCERRNPPIRRDDLDIERFQHREEGRELGVQERRH